MMRLHRPGDRPFPKSWLDRGRARRECGYQGCTEQVLIGQSRCQQHSKKRKLRK